MVKRRHASQGSSSLHQGHREEGRARRGRVHGQRYGDYSESCRSDFNATSSNVGARANPYMSFVVEPYSVFLGFRDHRYRGSRASYCRPATACFHRRCSAPPASGRAQSSAPSTSTRTCSGGAA